MANSSSRNDLRSALTSTVATVYSALLSLAVLSLLVSGCGDSPEPADAAASRRGAPQQITTKTGVEMVLIPSGEFVMGNDRGEDDEGPAHKVRVTAFYMDQYEVTQEAYETLMGRNPSKSKGPDKPVEQLSWYGAIRYCNMRSLREGLKTCYDPETLECDFDADGYRLPTEAEWEYGCRAGTQTRYSFGNDPGKLRDHGWFKANSNETTHPVGQRGPNPWGLYDMHGNVSEWCSDFYGESHYRQSALNDPRGPAAGEERILRGGNWRSTDESCSSSARYSEPPGLADVCFGYEAYGFRCVKRPPESVSE